MAVTLTTKITTAAQLAEKAKLVAEKCKTLYVYSCFGAPMTDSNKQYYRNYTSYNREAAQQKLINNASSDTFGFDCVCFIKGLLWGWCGDTSKKYGGATYIANGVPDVNADGMFKRCTDQSSDFSKIEVGEAVWMSGHIGVYIGDGLAVECTPSWKNKVQITAVGNIGAKSGYNKRTWTKHGKLPYVTYPKSSTGTTNTGSSTTTKPATPSAPTTTTKVVEKKATGHSKSFDVSLQGTYKVTAAQSLYIRNDAGINAGILGALPRDHKVECYGYYTQVGTVKWLKIQTTYNNVKYTGFCSNVYLKKV